MPTFPSPNDSTSSYTPGCNVSYPAHKLLATLFLVPETHKATCEIRDCKKKTQTSRGEKKMKQ
jgi:hypothetical protein